MSLPWVLLVIFVGWLCWHTWRSIQRSRDPRERALAMRGALAFWLLGLLFTIALVFLPNKARLLSLIPMFLLAGALVKAYRHSHAQLRASRQDRVQFENMKRVN
jgi:uncharacterized membrane protein